MSKLFHVEEIYWLFILVVICLSDSISYIHNETYVPKFPMYPTINFFVCKWLFKSIILHLIWSYQLLKQNSRAFYYIWSMYDSVTSTVSVSMFCMFFCPFLLLPNWSYVNNVPHEVCKKLTFIVLITLITQVEKIRFNVYHFICFGWDEL